MLCKVVTQKSNKLCVRSNPSTDARVVGYLYKNNIYDVKPVNENWAFVTAADTKAIGYASRAYLKEVAINEPTEQKNNDITITFTRAELKSMADYINSLLEG